MDTVIILPILQQQQQSFSDSYTALILEEAEKFYNELTTELTDRVMAAKAVAIKESSLPTATPGPSSHVKFDSHTSEPALILVLI